MKLMLERGGGIAGLRKPPIAVDTAMVSDGAALAALASRVLALPAPAGADAPDQVGYTLTITDDGGPHVIDFALGTAPADLRALVSALRKLAT